MLHGPRVYGDRTAIILRSNSGSSVMSSLGPTRASEPIIIIISTRLTNRKENGEREREREREREKERERERKGEREREREKRNIPYRLETS